MTFVALTVLSVIDAVLPYTNYDTSVIWKNVHRFVRPTVYSSPDSNWSYTYNAPNVRGATIVLLFTLSGPCLDMLNILTTE